MLNTTTISAREMLRNYKKVAKNVQKTGERVIVTSQKKPQVAIVNLKDLKILEEERGRRSTQATLKLIGIIPKNSGLPRDLSKNHDKYTWD
jgi:PHD/YefM family antitoxin component YafN of YafNO toxin-antitoxin module